MERYFRTVLVNARKTWCVVKWARVGLCICWVRTCWKLKNNNYVGVYRITCDSYNVAENCTTWIPETSLSRLTDHRDLRPDLQSIAAGCLPVPSTPDTESVMAYLTLNICLFVSAERDWTRSITRHKANRANNAERTMLYYAHADM